MLDQISTGTVLLNRYRLLELLSEGGLGSTWAAVPVETRSSGTVEVRIGLGEYSASYFRREWDFLKDINHPGVVNILEFGVDEELGLPVSISPSGDQTLKLQHFFREGVRIAKYPVEPIQLIRDLASTIDQIHAARIVHCDLSPDSVLVAPTGCIKIRDFFFAGRIGEAYVLEEETSKEGFSPFQLMALTPHYCSPEFLRDRLVTESVDKFAFAVISYRILTGHSPFHGSPPNAIRDGQLLRKSPVLSRRQYRAFARVLNEDPSQRIESFEDFVNAITPRKFLSFKGR